MLKTLLTFFAVGLVALLVLGLVLSVVGFLFALAWGVASFLLLKVAPILLLGWITLKLIERARGRPRVPSADRTEWIESGR